MDLMAGVRHTRKSPKVVGDLNDAQAAFEYIKSAADQHYHFQNKKIPTAMCALWIRPYSGSPKGTKGRLISLSSIKGGPIERKRCSRGIHQQLSSLICPNRVIARLRMYYHFQCSRLLA